MVCLDFAMAGPWSFYRVLGRQSLLLAVFGVIWRRLSLSTDGRIVSDRTILGAQSLKLLGALMAKAKKAVNKSKKKPSSSTRTRTRSGRTIRRLD